VLRAARRRATYAVRNASIACGVAGIVMLDVDPQEIRFVQFPELWTGDSSRRRQVSVRRLPGDWDQVDADVQFAWSGRYEAPGRSSRMVPIENFAFFRACSERFERGASWQSTGWYGWLRSRIAAGERILRYETVADLEARLAFLDGLYAEIRQEGYRSARARSASGAGWLRRFFSQPSEWHEPVINVGRQQRIAMEDGRHRLCLARIARVPSIRVRVSAVHPDARL
jgi:hypothetical protein